MPRIPGTRIEPQVNADRETLSLGRYLVSASESQIPIAPVPAQRVDALEGIHTAAQNAALKDGFSAVRFKVGRQSKSTSKRGAIMARKQMSRLEVDDLLSVDRVMRIGFKANGERYLVPLGFIWHRGALYAMTTQDRKTRMAAANPKVSFQIDTSARTGPFSWHSISGEGTFEVVTDSKELEAISPLLVSRFPDMPNWMQAEYAEKQKQGKVVNVRIRPSEMTGRKSEPA